MSYKKIVAGVATFAIAAAMVVPSAFAIEAQKANAKAESVQTSAESTDVQKAYANKVTEAIAEFEAASESLSKATKDYDEAVEKIKVKEANGEDTTQDKDDLKALNDAKKQEQLKVNQAQKKIDEAYERLIASLGETDKKDPAGPAKELNKYPGITVASADGEKFEVKDCGGTHTFTLDELTQYLERVKEFEGKKKDAVKKAEELLKCLDKFNDRTLEVKIGDYVFNNENVVVSLKEQIKKIESLTYCQNSMRELEMAIKWLNEQEKYVNAFMKMDPAALEKACKKGCSDKKADKAADKATAAKGGKHLPKTADAAPVAPFAAVAGSAALIAAGLVASRKVNA